AEGRVLNRISTEPGGEKMGVKDTLNLLFEQSVDAMSPLASLTKLLAEGKALEPNADPYIRARTSVAAASKANLFLEFEQRNLQGDIIGRALKDIMEPLRDNEIELNSFRAYAISKRAIELQKRGIETGLNIKDVKEVVKSGRKKYESMFRETVEYQNNLITLLKDEGMISPKMFDKIVEANKEYIPFFRLMDKSIPNNLGKGLRTRQPVKAIKGSEREIIDPIESIIKNTYQYVQLVERNAVWRTLVELAETAEYADAVMTKVDVKARPIKIEGRELKQLSEAINEEFGIEFTPEELTIFRTQRRNPNDSLEITGFRKGKREIWEVPAEVARVFNALDSESAGLLVKILSIPAKTLR
ncbi:hypothetical protein LCGC14_3038410, partial [marine sediment metagenome]